MRLKGIFQVIFLVSMSNFILVLCFVKLHVYFSTVHDAEPHLCLVYQFTSLHLLPVITLLLMN